jgi:pyroglutamyl-peptidase
MRVLISGFEPFGGHHHNPTALLIEDLKQRQLVIPPEIILESLLLPVTFRGSYQSLKKRVDEFNPDVVIAFGMAHERETIELESRAHNLIKAKIPDNEGERPSDILISAEGPEFYLSTLPLQGLEGALTRNQIPVKVSNSAGNFVCNYLFYKLMEENQESERLCGFIHVPSSISRENLNTAVSVILDYIQY